MPNKAVFLDRDGVINRSIVRDGKPYSPRTLADFVLLPYVPDAIQNLSSAGFLVFVVTNQPDIGNGDISQSLVDAMHQQLMGSLPIHKIYICPHSQKAGCDCRKPKPGMLLTAKAEFDITMDQSFMVGDRYGDICAANAAGCNPIFVDYGYKETPDFQVSVRVSSLFEASQIILAKLAN